jgi:aspartyl/asparaginyl-tRNA synthetase
MVLLLSCYNGLFLIFFFSRHLCEFTGLDLEMAINSHYEETLQGKNAFIYLFIFGFFSKSTVLPVFLVIHRMFRHIFQGLETRYSKELSVIRQQYPSEPVQFTEDPLILHWWDALQLLRDEGHSAEDFDDLSTAQEILLGEIVKKKYQTDFYIIDQYPERIRPFYTMPSPARDGKSYSNSYDIFLRGQEICSGAQRCHEPVRKDFVLFCFYFVLKFIFSRFRKCLRREFLPKGWFWNH